MSSRIHRSVQLEVLELERREVPARVIIDATPPQVVHPGQRDVLLAMFHVTGGGKVVRVDLNEVFGTTATENIRTYRLLIDAFGYDASGKLVRGGDGFFETSILLFAESDENRSVRFEIGGKVAQLHSKKPAWFMVVGDLEDTLSGETIGIDLTGVSTKVKKNGIGNAAKQRYFHAPPAIHEIAGPYLAGLREDDEPSSGMSPFQAALSPF